MARIGRIAVGGLSMELLIFYVTLALGVSFICSVLEAIILSVTPGFIQTEVSKGKGYARHLAAMKTDLDQPISAILTLNTIAHTMGAAGAGAQWKLLYQDTGEAIFAGVLTFLVLVFSEIIPKTIGAKFWRVLAAPATHLLRGMIKFLTWIPVLPALGIITRMVGGEPESHGVSRSELAAMAELSSRSGHLDDGESKILRNLFRFRTSIVRDIMTPRTVVYARAESLGLGEFLEDAMKTPFSRIPIYGKNRDDITGFVLKSDVMAAKLRDEEDGKAISEFKRTIPVVQSNVSVYEVFQMMSEESAQFMLVVDDFGGMEGVVTMEDVVETLLGMEIVDEADHAEDMQKEARRLWKRRAEAMGIRIEGDPGVESTNVVAEEDVKGGDDDLLR